MSAIPKPLVLIILDGWGYRRRNQGQRHIAGPQAQLRSPPGGFPNTLIHTSGRYVGLPTGQMGNSEVGHLNIGAGRIVYMDITRSTC